MNLLESSLSKLWRKNEISNCAAITAFRKYHNCGYDDKGEKCNKDEPKVLTKKENKERNLALASDLKNLGYTITKLIGTYPEGNKSVKEVSYFVQGDEKLEENIIRLGKKYNQDSVLYIPKGAIQGKAKAYLVGCNNCCNNWLKPIQKDIFEIGNLGYTSLIYTSKINGRPFIFEDLTLSDTLFSSFNDYLLSVKISKSLDKN